jgi:adenosylcobinamide-GDP ribazoletransferase
MKSFLTALAFLTIFPIRFRESPSPAIVAESRFWFPVVGFLLGVILAGWTELVGRLDQPALAAFLVLVAWVGLTGALHVDGFCDVCDGLFGGQTAEDRLRIMRDPHLGTFGLVGGVLLLLGKFAAIQSVIGGSGFVGWAESSRPTFALSADVSARAVCAAVVVARCLVLCVAAKARYPRPQGTGKVVIEATRWPEAIAFAVLAAAVSWYAAPDFRGVLALGIFLPPFLGVWLLRWICQRRLNGITGDCLGAAIEMSEVLFLISAAVAQRVAMNAAP